MHISLISGYKPMLFNFENFTDFVPLNEYSNCSKVAGKNISDMYIFSLVKSDQFIKIV